MKLNEYENAIDEFSLVIKLNPTYQRIHYNRGLAYLRLNDFKKAIEDFTLSLETEPMHAPSYYNRGAAYEKVGEAERAKKNIDMAIHYDKEYVTNSYCEQGRLKKEEGKYHEAIEHFTKAIEIAPSSYEAYMGRTILYLLIGEKEKADCDFVNLKAINKELASMMEHVLNIEVNKYGKKE